MLKQLSDQDASYLYVETPETPAHVGSLSLVDLPAGYRGSFFDQYKAAVASRMALIPFMHSKLAALPLDLDRPFWVEDPSVDIDYHVRRVSVPAPGGLGELFALVGELHATPLDRSRPLWEFYAIDGLATGQVAIYVKIHHTAMDGASSQAVVATLYDLTPVPRTVAAPVIEPDEGSGARSLARNVLVHRLQQVIRGVQYVPELLTALTHALLPDPATLKFHPLPWWDRAPTTLFNVGITGKRVYAARTLPLAAVKQLAKQTSTKVNDVILALCSGALRGYLADRGALPKRSMTAMVPVAPPVRPDVAAANRNGLFLCSLASHVADPYGRLVAIHRSAVAQKLRFELFNGFPLPDLPLPGIGAIVHKLVELYGRSRFVGRPPLLGNLVISNVQGSPTPLYIAGTRLASMYPCSIPFHGQALNITVESYCDRLDFGLVACPRAVPDLAELADRLADELAALQAAVARRGLAANVRPVGEPRSEPRATQTTDPASRRPMATGSRARSAWDAIDPDTLQRLEVNHGTT